MSSVFALQGIGGVGSDEEAVYPDVLLEVDWDNDGVFEGGDEDLSAQDDVRLVECWRGRDLVSQHVGRSVPGHLFALLNNDDDRYNSFNTGSPLTGNVTPGREIRLRATTPFAVTLWSGFTGEIKPRITSTREKRAELPASGPLSRVATRRVATAMGADILSGDAWDDVLDAAGWPAADRITDAGQETLPRWWQEHAFGINALREIEDTEVGFGAESHDGKILFEDRHHRLEAPHSTPQWTFSDEPADTTALRFQEIEQIESVPLVFNVFETRVRSFTLGSTTALWAHPFAIGSDDVPVIEPGQSKDFWATYPTPDAAIDTRAADSWVTPVFGTDIFANTVNNPIFPDVSATYLTISTVKYGQRMKFTLTNSGPYLLYLGGPGGEGMRARGVRILESDQILISTSDATSIAKYGERTYPTRTLWVASTATAFYWGQYLLSILKDPIAYVAIEFNANKDLFHCHAALKVQVSDRITITATGNSGLGIDEDFFVERKEFRLRPGKELWCRLECSPVSVTGEYAVLDDAALGLLNTAKLGF